MNIKVDALIKMSVADNFESTQCIKNHYQTILILDKVKVLSVESEVNFYQWIFIVNQIIKFCNEYKQAISKNKLKLHSIKLKNCKIINNILFKKDLLWIFENMHMKLLQKIHDQSFIFHFNNKRTVNLVKCFYYWSDHQVTIKQYIQNCHVYQQSKTFNNSINELLHSFLISQKFWKDIIMNFIIKLFLSEDYNIICIIICWFLKKHHYVFCHWEDESISVNEMI